MEESRRRDSGHGHDDSKQDSEKQDQHHPSPAMPPTERVSDDAGSRLTTLGNPSHGARRTRALKAGVCQLELAEGQERPETGSKV